MTSHLPTWMSSTTMAGWPGLCWRSWIIALPHLVRAEASWTLSTDACCLHSVYVYDCMVLPGKRLLKQWLCAPLCDPRAIHDRLDAVATLISHAHLVGETRDMMKSLPDLQRLLRQ